MRRLILTSCFLFSLALIAGCTSSSTTAGSGDKLYDLKGKVVSIESGAKSITIDHEDIPGKMKAMKMAFSVTDATLLEGLAPGDTVEGKLKILADKYIITELHRKAAAVKTASADPALPVSRDADELAKIKKNLAMLSDADRKLAEEQHTCPIEGEPLGAMGKPIKLTIKGQPVFICCKGCKETAEKNPDETLKKVAELKKKKQ